MEFLLESPLESLLNEHSLRCAFCDSNTKSNPETYPMAPCGKFNRSYESLPTDWKSSSWAWYSSTSFKLKGNTPGRVLYKVCMGCISCTNPDCGILIRPKVRYNGQKILEQLGEICDNPNCRSALRWDKCSAKCYWKTYDIPNESGAISVLDHRGHHYHPLPPPIKPSPTEFKQLTKRVEAAPDLPPLKLKIGQSLEPGHPLGPVREISTAFNSLDRIAYYRSKIIQQSGIITKTARKHSDDFAIQFSHFQQDHPNFIKHTDFTAKVVIIAQTPWMKLQLSELLREEGSKNLGSLTDTTYSFFKSGFLLTTSIYSTILKRWIPVVLSFIAREDETHITEHFQYLIQCLQEVIPSEQFGKVLDEVVDYSQAQNNSFVRAYVNVMMKKKLAIDPKMTEGMKAVMIDEFEKDAHSHLKGCWEHYRASVSRIKKMKDVVPQNTVEDFVKSAMHLVEIKDYVELIQETNSICTKWPLCQPWLDWWMHNSAAKTLFKAQRTISDDAANKIPDSTNAQEAMHRYFYMASNKSHSIITGLESLLLICGTFQADYELFMKQGAKALNYGQHNKLHTEEHWDNTCQRIARIVGQSTSVSQLLQISAPVSDRRPPDNSLTLGKLNGKSTRTRWGRSQRVKKPLAKTLGVKTKTRAKIPSQAVKEGELPSSYQSYPHFGNSCYITAPSEVLYTCFLRDHEYWIEHIGNLPDTFGLRRIYDSFVMRDETVGSAQNLVKNIKAAREHIRTEVIAKNLEKDKKPGSPDHWIQYFVQTVPSDQKMNFGSLSVLCRGTIRLALCGSGHLKIKTVKPLPWFSINGLQDWEGHDFLVDEVGSVEALLQKKLLAPKTIITIDSTCSKEESNECSQMLSVEADIIVHMPRTLIFYVNQRDGKFYNASAGIDFPYFIRTSDSETALEYGLTGKVFSTQSTGVHFYSKVIREFDGLCGVYHYDDLHDSGKATLFSVDPNTLSGKEELTIMAMYSLVSDEDRYKRFLEERTGLLGSILQKINVNISSDSLQSSINALNYFSEKDNQFHNSSWSFPGFTEKEIECIQTNHNTATVHREGLDVFGVGGVMVQKVKPGVPLPGNSVDVDLTSDTSSDEAEGTEPTVKKSIRPIKPLDVESSNDDFFVLRRGQRDHKKRRDSIYEYFK